MNRKTLRDQVALIRRIILETLPTNVSFAAIIIALAEVLVMMQEQALNEEE